MKTLSITSNMGFSFSRSTTISQCAVRFWGEYVPDVGISTAVGPTYDDALGVKAIYG